MLRVLHTLAEDLSLFLNTHVGRLTTIYNSSSKGSDTFFCPLKAPAYMWHMQIYVHIRKHVHANNNHNKTEVVAILI